MRNISAFMVAIIMGCGITYTANAKPMLYYYPDDTLLISDPENPGICGVTSEIRDNYDKFYASNKEGSPQLYVQFSKNEDKYAPQFSHPIDYADEKYNMEMDGEGQESINVKIEKFGDKYGFFRMDINKRKEDFMFSYIERHNYIRVKVKSNKFLSNDVLTEPPINWFHAKEYMQHFNDCVANKGPAPGYTKVIDPEHPETAAEPVPKPDTSSYSSARKAEMSALTPADFMSYGDEVIGKKVSVKGMIYCRDLNSCNIISDDVDYRKSIWFSATTLPISERKEIMACSMPTQNGSSCMGTVTGIGRTVYVTEGYQKRHVVGINSIDVKMLSMGDLMQEGMEMTRELQSHLRN